MDACLVSHSMSALLVSLHRMFLKPVTAGQCCCGSWAVGQWRSWTGVAQGQLGRMHRTWLRAGRWGCALPLPGKQTKTYACSSAGDLRRRSLVLGSLLLCEQHGRLLDCDADAGLYCVRVCSMGAAVACPPAACVWRALLWLRLVVFVAQSTGLPADLVHVRKQARHVITSVLQLVKSCRTHPHV